MKAKLKVLAMCGIVALLVLLNVQLAYGHDWWWYCWHKGSTLGVWVYGSNQAEANAALNDWDSHTHVNFSRPGSHTDISVWGANFGATGWWGLASIESTSYDWWHHWWWCRIEHAHARYNSYYGGTSGDIQGVLCQEIGHTLGLDHSNTGDCMGKSYYNNINVTGPHNWSDINSKF
ncbi:MAG TPA: hypothetical protein VGA01_08140 [Candidatus Binatia bacterium]